VFNQLITWSRAFLRKLNYPSAQEILSCGIKCLYWAHKSALLVTILSSHILLI